MIKKISFIFLILFFLSCNAQNLIVSDTPLKDNLRNDILNIKDKVKNVLKEVQFKNEEFIVLTGKISKKGELFDYNKGLYNISDDVADKIIKELNNAKLHLDLNLENFDRFKLYVGSAPIYKKENIIVLFCPEREKMSQDEILYKSQINKYCDYIYYNNIYPITTLLEAKNLIPNKVGKIAIEIDKNGNLISADIVKSLNKEIDETILKQLNNSAPFEKFPSEWTHEILSTVFNISASDILSNKIKSNLDASMLKKDYNLIIKVELDKKGNVINAQIYTSSNNDEIDEKIINAIKKVGNFIEFISLNDIDNRTIYLNVNNNQQTYGFNAFSQNNPNDWRLYMSQFEKQARKNWKPPVSYNSYDIVADILINKEGEVLDIKIIKSAEPKAVKAVIQSIIKGAPYEKLPKETELNIIAIRLTFSYKILNENYSNNYHNSPSKYNPTFNSHQDIILRLMEKKK